MAIKLEMLRVFRVVAEAGSLSSAADQLGRTPSAVSMMLAQLEDNVGAPLFETDRKNRLSKLGELIYAEAVRATDVFESSANAIRRLTTSTAGTVRIAAVPSVIVTLLPVAIAEFRKTRPEVRLEISDVDTASVRRRVRQDEADIGIVSSPAGETGEGVAILRDTLGIAFHAGGEIDCALEKGGAAPSWSLLGLEPLIANPLCGLVDSPEVASRLETCNLQARNTTALLSFVREGLGATILPESALPHRADGIGFVLPADPVAERDLRMIAGSGRRLNPAAETFWNLLADQSRNGSDLLPRRPSAKAGP